MVEHLLDLESRIPKLHVRWFRRLRCYLGFVVLNAEMPKECPNRVGFSLELFVRRPEGDGFA